MKATLTSTTNDFATVKAMAHHGVLQKIRLVWSFKYMAFIYKFTISTIVK